MKIFVSHSSSFKFHEDLYTPLRESALNKEHNIILPHESGDYADSKKEILTSTIIIAEVSRPSTGTGIELGWADDAKIPIICVYGEGTHPSTSLRSISSIFIQYSGAQDMIEKISTAIAAVRSTM